MKLTLCLIKNHLVRKTGFHATSEGGILTGYRHIGPDTYEGFILPSTLTCVQNISSKAVHPLGYLSWELERINEHSVVTKEKNFEYKEQKAF